MLIKASAEYLAMAIHSMYLLGSIKDETRPGESTNHLSAMDPRFSFHLHRSLEYIRHPPFALSTTFACRGSVVRAPMPDKQRVLISVSSPEASTVPIRYTKLSPPSQ